MEMQVVEDEAGLYIKVMPTIAETTKGHHVILLPLPRRDNGCRQRGGHGGFYEAIGHWKEIGFHGFSLVKVLITDQIMYFSL